MPASGRKHPQRTALSVGLSCEPRSDSIQTDKSAYIGTSRSQSNTVLPIPGGDLKGQRRITTEHVGDIIDIV